MRPVGKFTRHAGLCVGAAAAILIGASGTRVLANSVDTVVTHTTLEVSHADITAVLLGCDIGGSKTPVFVNGRPPNGSDWSLLGVQPSRPFQPSGYAKKIQQLIGTETKLPAVVSLRLKPGYYSSLSLKIGSCSVPAFALIASDAYGARTITLLGANQAATQQPEPGAGGLYGSMPAPALKVLLLDSHSNCVDAAEDEATKDSFGPHYMYFFDAVPPGTYALVVRGPGYEKRIGTVNLPGSGKAIYREIKVSELTR